MTPTLRGAGFAALETVLNRALALDPAAYRQLAALTGQVFHLHCNRPELDLFLIVHPDQLQLAGHWEGAVTARLSGSADDFARLVGSRDAAAELINGGMKVSGDSRALQQLQLILRELEPDWEAPLAQLFGDVAGHQLGRGLRHGATLLREAGRSLSRQLRDYLGEESGWLAARWQVDDFSAGVDDAVARCDRLAARIAQLQQRAAQRR